ncbi:hypothetical protein BGZ60DRAFT_514511 [Tricladium varicosporioides]|nr:hypothetical protein BGZ60DRAFT_514511 [Hymenoscyphus varicosporioides]
MLYFGDEHESSREIEQRPSSFVSRTVNGGRRPIHYTSPNNPKSENNWARSRSWAPNVPFANEGHELETSRRIPNPGEMGTTRKNLDFSLIVADYEKPEDNKFIF